MSSSSKQENSLPENTKNFSKVYQFMVKVDHGHEVPIWRTIEVPDNYSFYDLHVAIQDVMSWLDYHLHKFDMMNPVTMVDEWIGIPDDAMDEFDDNPIVPEKTAQIADYFTMSNRACSYQYDFGSPWNLSIYLKEILPANVNINYPRCIAGECHSPPEDCPEDPSDMSWVQKPFDINNITFRDPSEAWLDAFQGF